jgi:hypothetical protein
MAWRRRWDPDLEGALLQRVYERFLRMVGPRVELACFQREEKGTGRAEIPWPKVDEIPLTENLNAPILIKAESYQEQARRSGRLTYSP